MTVFRTIPKTAIISIAIFWLFSTLLVFRQESFSITGYVTFNGVFEKKIDQYVSLNLIIISLTAVFYLFGLWGVSGFLARARLPASDTNISRELNLVTLERVIKGCAFSIAFCATLLFLAVSLNVERWDYASAGKELVAYGILLFGFYLFCYLVTDRVWESAIFPSLTFLLFVNQAISISGLPVSMFAVSTDTYHSGEYYIPARLLADGIFGFYQEYNPSRGLTNYYPAFAAMVFDELSSVERLAYYEITFVRFVLVALSFLLLSGSGIYVRGLTSLFLGMFFIGGIYSAVAIIVPVTWLMCRNVDFSRPIRTVGLVLIASIALLFHSVGEGVLWSISVFIVLIPQLFANYSIVKSYGFRVWLIIGLLMSLYFIAILYVAPNLLSYVIGNGSLNTAAFAILNLNDFDSDMGRVKYGFVYFSAIIFSFSIFFHKFGQVSIGNFSLIIAGIPMVGLVRFMGRDDFGAFSRPFAATMLTCFGVFILSVYFSAQLRGVYRFGIGLLSVVLVLIFGWFGEASNRLKDFSFLAAGRIHFHNSLPENVKSSLRSVKVFSEIRHAGCRHLVDLTGNNSILALSDDLSYIPTTSPYNAVSISEQKAIISVLKEYITSGGVCVRVLHQNIFHDGRGMFLRTPLLSKFIMSELRIVDVGEHLPVTGVWMSSADMSVGHEDTETLEEVDLLTKHSDLFKDLNFLPLSWGRATSGFSDLKNSEAGRGLIPTELRGKVTFAVFSKAEENKTTGICEIFRRSGSGGTSSLTFRFEDSGIYAVPLYGHSHWYLDDIDSIDWSCPSLDFLGYITRDDL